mgnify:CR=1 FL=1
MEKEPKNVPSSEEIKKDEGMVKEKMENVRFVFFKNEKAKYSTSGGINIECEEKTKKYFLVFLNNGAEVPIMKEEAEKIRKDWLDFSQKIFRGEIVSYEDWWFQENGKPLPWHAYSGAAL